MHNARIHARHRSNSLSASKFGKIEDSKEMVEQARGRRFRGARGTHWGERIGFHGRSKLLERIVREEIESCLAAAATDAGFEGVEAEDDG